MFDDPIDRIKNIVGQEVGLVHGPIVRHDDVKMVWFNKTLQHWKGIAMVPKLPGVIWELTHNGDKGETYVDEYKKQANNVYPDKKD